MNRINTATEIVEVSPADIQRAIIEAKKIRHQMIKDALRSVDQGVKQGLTGLLKGIAHLAHRRARV